MRWGQDNDKNGSICKAQELVECLLQSLIEVRMIQPQVDAKLAILIGWAAAVLSERDSIPRAAEDLAHSLGFAYGSCRV